LIPISIIAMSGCVVAPYGYYHRGDYGPRVAVVAPAMQRTLPAQVRISQGEFVGRPSTLFLEVNRERQVFVGGDVLELGKGTVTL
jgi:predicted PhzF superfamily epimerase YddE/YHI9